VRYNDMTGPLADKALFLSGSVRFFRKDYKEADHYYSQLVEMHPNSPYASQALELAIISKQLSTGGPLYDGRKLAEARKLVDTALRNYPEFANKKMDFLNRQLVSITMQQADKDYQVAELYRRMGHPCSAYFCYEIVRRRYPGTKYSDLATQRLAELSSKYGDKGLQPPPPPGVAARAPEPPSSSPMDQVDRSGPRPLPTGVVNEATRGQGGVP
jgi:outer membrane protein assembly factor BamD (BamD/ComL family)